MHSSIVLTNPFGPAWCDLACTWNSSESWAWSHPVALRLMDSLTCSPVVYCISKNVILSMVRTALPIKLFLIFVFASTSIAAIRRLCLHWACFLNWPSGSKSGRSELSSRTWQGTRKDDPSTHCLGKCPVCCTKLFRRIRQLIQQLLDICLVNVQVFPRSVSHRAETSRMVPDLPHVPMSFSKNKVHKDSTSFGLVKEFLADLRTMRIHSKTLRSPAQRSQPCAKVIRSV